jgi:hypothetical protein
MRQNTFAVVGRLGVVTVAALVLGLLSWRASAQGGSFHVLTVASGGFTCGDMTHNLRVDRDVWRSVYYNYMAGFITGANFVSYSAGGRNANIASDLPHDAVLASIERYCAQNPAQNISEAVVRVYSQLVAQ